MTTLKARSSLLLSLIGGRIVGALAFFLAIAMALWSIELALYYTAALLVASLIPFLRPVTFLGILAGQAVIWWEFLRAFFVAILEPHSIFGYLGLGIAFTITAIILFSAAVLSFGMLILAEDVVNEPEVKQADKTQDTLEEIHVSPFNPYLVLDIEKDASREEIHRRYRTLMQQYHPDKVQHLGSDLQDLARQKTIEIKEAFERICALS